MGGFLGIGKSGAEKALDRQRELAQAEADQARREAEIRLAEKRAKKGQETANIKLGTTKKSDIEEDEEPRRSSAPQISSTLGFTGKKTGVQI